MSNRLNPENVLRYVALANATDAAGRTSGYYSLKHAKRARFIVSIVQGHATPPALSLKQATNVAGTGTKGCDTNHQIWATNDVAVTKDATRQTDAAGFTPDAALVKELQDHVKAEISPYKYPRLVEFVSDLPRTDTGKLKRVALREIAAAGSRPTP